MSAEDDLWSSILDQLDGHTSVTNKDVVGTRSGALGKLRGIANIFFLKGETEIGTQIDYTRGKEVQQSRSVTLQAAAVNKLRDSCKPLIIDDFHYLSREVQGTLVRALKSLIFDGLPVILIAIPHRRFDAVRVEREMTGRVETVQIPLWTSRELMRIPEEGFRLLNLEISTDILKIVADEAAGSPHLMQEFCRMWMKAIRITETMPSRTMLAMPSFDIFQEVAKHTSKLSFDKLARGPRTSTKRTKRAISGGYKGDLYEIVLDALPPLLEAGAVNGIKYETLREAVRAILVDEIPKKQEVCRVLRNMSIIAASEKETTPVIEWDEEEEKLHIADPFFAFYLKWGRIRALPVEVARIPSPTYGAGWTGDELAGGQAVSITPSRRGTRIFLAHGREDKAQVRKLYADLKARGFHPWLDEVDLMPGQIWTGEIAKAIRQAGLFLVCMSSRSTGKPGYVQSEIRLALQAFGERPPESIFLIPVRLDDCEVPDLQIPDRGLSLRAIQWIDLWQEGGFDRLVMAIDHALGSA